MKVPEVLRLIEEVRKNTREAVEFHLEGLRSDGEPVPAPSAMSDYVEAA